MQQLERGAAMSHRLAVLPDDSARSILDPIHAATDMLNIRMFLFTDPTLLNAVIAARKRGVKVRVMLNPARRDGTSENEAAKEALAAAGIEVRHSNPAFAVTHQKSMVIDGKEGFIESFNWKTRDLTVTRDYAVVTTKKQEIDEMVEGFEADWSRQPFNPPAGSPLIWCPNNGRERVAEFIDGAKETLCLQNERFQDMVIIERLTRAVERGVRVQIMVPRPHKLKQSKLVEGVSGLRVMHDVGAKVRTLEHLKLHAKMIIADDKRALVGSINLAPGSFDARRELAVETDSHHVVKRLVQISQYDWNLSHKLDLSEKAVAADLEEHGFKDIKKLAIT
jgi:phosphatidylserine/phosphatidylglycerophosphate/cardiolipin synthase-like enzyme